MGLKLNCKTWKTFLIIISLTVFFSGTTPYAAGADTTPPQFADGYPQEYEVYHPGSKHVSMVVKPKDETVKAYYVIVDHGSTAPDKNQVMAGTDANGSQPHQKGTQEGVGTNGYIITPGELPADDTVYDIYVVIQDTTGNASEPAKLELKTPVKLLTDGYPKVGAAQATGTKQVQILNKANGGCTAYWMAVADNDIAPLPGEIKQGMAGGYPSPIAAGSVELTANVEAPALIALPADATDYDVYVMLYKYYAPGSFIMGIESEIVKLDVTTPPAAVPGAVCEIVGGAQYETLNAAIAAVGDGETKTIRMLGNLDHIGGVIIDGKNITIDLDGHTVNITDLTADQSALTVRNGSNLVLSGTGAFNVIGDKYGVLADNGTAVVTHATANDIGACARNNGTITIKGNAIGTGDSGALAGNGSTIVVQGNAQGYYYGVDAMGLESSVSVKGNTEATANGGFGVRAFNGGRVAVEGNAIANSGFGAHADDDANGHGEITIDGEITAGTYIKVGDDDFKIKDDYANPTTKDGYRTYTDGTNVVWVNVPVQSITVIGTGGATRVRNGKTLQMSATVLPDDALDSVTWSLENVSGAATINDNGLLTGTSVGTVMVKATANDGSGIFGTLEVSITSSSGGGGGSKKSSPEEPVVVEPEAPATVIVLIPNSSTALVNNLETVLDGAPFIKPDTGRAVVPIRFVSEQLGAKVEWLKETRQVKIAFDDITIILTIGSNQVLVNGALVVIDSPAEIVGGRTYVPLRFVSETLGATATWDEVARTITITK